MEKEKKKKGWLPFASVMLILIATLGLIFWGIFAKGGEVEAVAGYIRLNQRDIAIDVGETAELEIAEVEAAFELADAKVKWISNNPSVASVDESGIVTGVAGGEARITVVAKNGRREYTASCIVTVKAAGLEYSSYQIQWYTQRKDRNGYEVLVETYERLVGSEVNLTKQDAKEKLPGYYVLNEDKCVLNGTVKESKAGCVLKVYYDVVEISYAVDYYYESGTALGTYELKETKQYKAHAFSEVNAPLDVAEGFIVNTEAKGSILTVDSVVSKTRLKVYCERIRSGVTIKYASERQQATYENVYGVGLVGAPADALEESLAPYETAGYISGKMVADIQSAVKELTEDTKIEFKVVGRGFTYQKDGSLLEDYYNVASTAYTYLQGSGKTIYLSANYNLTGSATNLIGITLRSGDENRQILFNNQGVVVLKNYKWQAGTVSKKEFEFNHENGSGYILVQNRMGHYETNINSVIQNMLTNTEASSHDVVWAVWEGTLYCSVDGIVAVRLPLNLLVETWTADTELEIGFAAYDGAKIGDEFMLRDVDVQYNGDAKDMLHTDGEAPDSSEIYRQVYDPLSGAYIAPAIYGATWIYGTETAENSGITADVTWMDKDNTGTMVGVSVRMGDASVQYYIRGQNWSYQTLNNHQGDSHRSLDIKRINSGTPFDEDGSCKMGAYVKDGYFYVTYNGMQVQCINMLSLFQDYTKDSEVSVGICTLETCVGLAYIENIEVLDEEAVAEQQCLTEWKFYSEEIYGQPAKCDFAEGTIVKDKAGYHEATLLGSSEAWHVKGVMKRTDAKDAGDLLMGFVISSGGKSMSLYGHNNGFVYNWKFSNNGGTNRYAFGDSHGQFFHSTRNIDELPFEMVIYEDILYVYLDGELSWRIPLTEEQFGFEKGSRYKVKLSMVEPDRKGAIADIEVRMGYQVTDETEFMTYKGKNYSFKKAMSKTEANVAKYQDINNVYWRGNLLEEITFTTKEGQAYLATEGDEYQGLKTTIVHQDVASGSLYNGILLKSGEETARIIVDSGANVLILQQGEKASTAKAFSEIASAYVDDKCELTVVVKDEKLFVTANGTPLGAIELKELLKNYKKDAEITFGICSDNLKQGVVGFADITILTGNEEDIEYSDSKMQLTDVKFMVAGITNGMKADSLNGKVTTNLTDGGVNHLWFATDNASDSSENWEIAGTFKQLAGLMKGFTIQSADGTKAGYYTMWTGGVALNERWGSPVAGGWNAYSADGKNVFTNADYDALSGNNVAKKFKVIIRDDIFSFFVEDKLVWQLPLTNEKFGGFAEGTSYRFALRCLDNGGKAEWSDLTVKYGKNVGKYKFLVGSMSNGMTADTMNGNVVTSNMTNNKATNHLYFATDNATNSSKSWEITGTFEQIKAGLMNGFTIRSADGTKVGYYTMYGQSVALNEKWGWPITGNAWNTHSVDGQYVFANSDYEDIADYGKINKAKKFKAVIKDDVFSFFVEDKLVWQLPLTDARFGGFTAGTSYQFALRHRDEGGQAQWSNLNVKYGEDIGAYKFQVASMTNGVTADTIKGKVIADHASTAVRNLYFAADNEANSSTSWEITGTMTQSGGGMKLFILQTADGTKTEYYTIYDNALIKSALSPWDWRKPADYPDYVFNHPSTGLSYTHDPLRFKAVIENDQFTFWIEDQRLWSVPLTNSNFGGFVAGTSYRMAIGSSNGQGTGQVEWSDLTVKYGK